MSSRRGQSDGSFRLAWHAKPGAARRMSTKRPHLLGRIRLADERDLAGYAKIPSRNTGEDCSWPTRYLGQPFLGRPSKLGFRTKGALYLVKVHPCPSQRHGEMEEHFVSSTGLSFRGSPNLLGPLNQHLIDTGPRNLGLAQHLDPRH
jgi:hypothetical protein